MTIFRNSRQKTAATLAAGFVGLGGLWATGTIPISALLLATAAAGLTAAVVRPGRRAAEPELPAYALDGFHDEVYMYRADTLALVYMNTPALERYGWDSVDGHRITDTDPSFDEELFRSHVVPLMDRSSTSVSIEAKQQKRYVEIVTSLITQDTGDRLFVSVLRDIDARKRIDRAKMSSVSVVSHELRTPLTSIKGSLELFQAIAKTRLSDSETGLIDMAVRNSDRLLFIVNDILDLEKIESGNMRYDRMVLDLNALLVEATEVNAGFGAQHKVRFVLERGNTGAFVDADRDRLLQVLSNLMSNAVKHSDPGSAVFIRLTEQGAFWRLSVADRGPGIPDDDIARIFETFSQLSAVDGKKRPGTGLGLAISKRITEHFGGTLSVESELHKGSVFHVDLPKAEAPAAQESPALAG